MPIQINVAIPQKTQAPDIPPGLFVTVNPKFEDKRVLVRVKMWANAQAWLDAQTQGSTVDPLEQLPGELFRYKQVVLTNAQYQAGIDVIGAAHTLIKSELEALPLIGAGNTSLVNYPVAP